MAVPKDSIRLLQHYFILFWPYLYYIFTDFILWGKKSNNFSTKRDGKQRPGGRGKKLKAAQLYALLINLHKNFISSGFTYEYWLRREFKRPFLKSTIHYICFWIKTVICNLICSPSERQSHKNILYYQNHPDMTKSTNYNRSIGGVAFCYSTSIKT